MDLVVDASVAVAWFFEDEPDPHAEAILGRLRDGSITAVAPAIWPSEVVNALLIAERRGRISEAKISRYVAALADLAVAVENTTVALIAGGVLALAREHALTVYDATYLDLAVRTGLPLASSDGKLRRAATATGVTLAK